jgi:transposase-like protein
MPRKGRSNEEIIHALHQVEGGEKVAEVCRRLGVSENTLHTGRQPQLSGFGRSGDLLARTTPLRELKARRRSGPDYPRSLGAL